MCLDEQVNDTPPILSVTGLDFSYRKQDGLILRDVSLSIPKGSCVGLLGPNGAGKSTLISLMTGVVSVQNGAIKVDGESVNSTRKVREISACAPQQFAFYPKLTVRENLNYFAAAYDLHGADGQKQIAFAIEACGLEALTNRQSARMSGGEKRRLNLAIALMKQPRLLFLDEPTVGIDASSRRAILQAIKTANADGTTVVYTSHYMEEVDALCDRIAVIMGGEIILDGAKSDLLSNSAGELYINLSTPLAPSSMQPVSELGGVLLDNSKIVLRDRTWEDAISLASRLRSEGVSVASVEIGARRLEDVYFGCLNDWEAARC